MRTRSLFAVLIALFALIGVAGPASAHNELLKTDPADGSTIATLPDHIGLTFNLPALGIGTAITVTGPGGDVATGKPSLVDDTVTQPLDPNGPAGAYQVVWRITSADGHPISGTFSFTTTSGSSAGPTVAAAPVAPEGGSSSTSPWLWVGLGVAVLVVIGGVGLALRRPGPVPD